jgi:hypothetical protein
MARESKKETLAREIITQHLQPGETLQHFTWGGVGSSTALHMAFGLLGALIARNTQQSYFVGLTDRRLVLVKAKGFKPTSEAHSISLEDIKGMKYSRGLYSGVLKIQLVADKLEIHFDSRPWYPRAQAIAKLMPLSA